MYFEKEIKETCRAIVNIKIQLREYQNQEVKCFYQAKKIENLGKELRICECLLKEYLELS